MVRPAFHTRYDHSELLAEMAIYTGITIGLPMIDVRHSMTAGWFHDVGHSGFSHCGDELLVKYGYPNHEERAREKIFREAKTLENQGIDLEKIIDIIYEKGELGVLQKMLDTLSYLVLDSGMMKNALYDDHGLRVLSTIKGVEDGLLVVKDVSMVQELLDFRGQMYQDVYYHPFNKMMDESRRRLMTIMMREWLIEEEQIVEGDDHILGNYIQSMVQEDRGAAMMAGRMTSIPMFKRGKDLYSFSIGFIPEEWERKGFDSEEEVNNYLWGRRLDERAMEQAFVTEPFDYTKKTLKVRGVDGEVHELGANVKLLDRDKVWTVYAPSR